MNKQDLMETLCEEGYDKVSIEVAKPREYDAFHEHSFDTKIIMVEGEMEIEMDGKKTALQPGDSTIVPRNKKHSSFAGASGCRFAHGEKH